MERGVFVKHTLASPPKKKDPPFSDRRLAFLFVFIFLCLLGLVGSPPFLVT
jgi:hypothetical protein